MTAQVQLGPTPLASKTSLTPMMKEISQRKSHIDLVFICDDGSASGHKFVVGAQSKFLKGLLKLEDHGDKTELRLPGIQILHLKRAVKFMYTGQLKMTKQEIEKEHMVWHVNHILIDLFRVDAKLNLPAHLLKPPPKKPEPDPPPSAGREGGASGGLNGHSSSSTPSQGGSGSNSPKVSEVDHTRQNAVIPVEVPEDMGGKETWSHTSHYTDRKRHMTGDSEIQEVEQERVATPDIIDLLDSDPEDDNTTNAQGNLNEESEAPESPIFFNVNNEIDENSRNNNNGNVSIPEAPKLIQRSSPDATADNVVPKQVRAVARKHTASLPPKFKAQKQSEDNTATDRDSSTHSEPLASGTDAGNVEVKKKRPVARKHTGPRGSVKKSKPNDIFSLAMKEAEIGIPFPELPIARKSVIEHVPRVIEQVPQVMEQKPQFSPINSFMPPIDIMATFRGLQPLPPSMLTQFGHRFPAPSFVKPSPIPRLGPTQTIYRGKIADYRKISKPSTSTRAVRKHNHIPWTMTGLKRAETFAVVKEEKAIHTCDICGVKYEKYRSLEIHKRRIHNANSKVECPEGCGKLLSSTTAIRKHLLSHRPEEEWPHECPLCHKKFQARGDIPKHLKTRIHENDNIPIMGTKEWFDLIYHDDPKFDYGAMKVKIEKQEARERSKLPPGLYPASVINLEEYEKWDPTDPTNSDNGTNSGTYTSSPHDSHFVMASTSQAHQPSFDRLDGLEDLHGLLATNNQELLNTEENFNILSDSEPLSVFTEDGLFSGLGTEASVLL